MACWICTFGSAYSSIFELNSAAMYFHALTNGLAMGTFPPSNLSGLRFCLVPTYRFAHMSGHRHRHDLRNDDLRGGIDAPDAPSCAHLTACQLLAGIEQHPGQRHLQRVTDRGEQLT